MNFTRLQLVICKAHSFSGQMIPFATQFSIFSDLDHDQLYKEKKGNEKIVEMQAPASKVHLVLLSP